VSAIRCSETEHEAELEASTDAARASLPHRAGIFQRTTRQGKGLSYRTVRQVQDGTAPLIYAVLISSKPTDGLQCPPYLSTAPCNRTPVVHSISCMRTPFQIITAGCTPPTPHTRRRNQRCTQHRMRSSARSLTSAAVHDQHICLFDVAMHDTTGGGHTPRPS
jgi:hypothetical protein